ncbi:MAG TPA: hypothetical protein VL918_07395 [Sphingobium sp.]|nr:hypothetical protein [Sphingobium sp.]
MKAPAAALLALAASLAMAPSASAQTAAPAAAPDTEKVKQVIVYGDDPCPTSDSGEILVCARLPDGDRYRIPKELRTDPNDPRVQSWANRAQSIEYVGRSGTESCSPVGAGGFTGCFEQLARAAKEERKAMLGSASWADLVAKERQKRLSAIDAESEAIEARVKAEEAARSPAEPSK